MRFWSSVHVFAGCLLVAIPALCAAAPPPLAPNEEIVRTLDGCGVVIDKDSPGAKYTRENFANLTWGSACIDGLATGQGIISPGVTIPGQPARLSSEGWLWYGRPFGAQALRWENDAVNHVFIWDGRVAYYSSLDPSTAIWSEVHSQASSVSDGETHVSTRLLPKPAVVVIGSGASQQYECPKGPIGKCAALWTEHAGPVIARIKEFLAGHDAPASARIAEVEALVEQWISDVGPAVADRRSMEASNAIDKASADASRRAEFDAACWDKNSKAPSLFGPGPSSETYSKRARYLQTLFRGECAGHSYASHALEEADKLLADAAESRKREEKERVADAQRAAEERWQREQNRQATLKAIGELADAYSQYQAAKNGDSTDSPAYSDNATPNDTSSSSQEIADVASANDLLATGSSNVGTGEMVNDCLVGDARGDRNGLRNTCNYEVEFTWCVFRPDPDSWSTPFDCEQNKFGASNIHALDWAGGHMSGPTVHWIACKAPDTPYKARYDQAEGRVTGSCYDWSH